MSSGIQVFGIRLIGVSAENARKLLLTIAFLVFLWLFAKALSWIARQVGRDHHGKRVEFWTRQVIQLATAVVGLVGFLSIWFSDPGHLTNFLGLVTAGIAFALQRVVTAIAGYFILLRGRTFNVGDRIKMGGVRGDVIALGFFQTTMSWRWDNPPPHRGKIRECGCCRVSTRDAS